jgi:hypothetical protein
LCIIKVDGYSSHEMENVSVSVHSSFSRNIYMI